MPTSFVQRTACEVCGAKDSVVLLSRAFTDPSVWGFLSKYYEGRLSREDVGEAMFEVRGCSTCDFIWQSFILDEEGMKKLYEDWIGSESSQEKKAKAALPFFTAYARDMERIASLLEKKPGELHLIDYGMGWGYWCLMAKAFGFKVTGIELSRERIEFATANGIATLDDISRVAAESVGFVNADQVFEHIPAPKNTLKELAALLLPQGVIRIAVPDGGSVRERLKDQSWSASKDALHPLEHINCFTGKSLVHLAREAGLELISPWSLWKKGPHFLRYLPHFLYHQYATTALYFKKRSL